MLIAGAVSAHCTMLCSLVPQRIHHTARLLMPRPRSSFSVLNLGQALTQCLLDPHRIHCFALQCSPFFGQVFDQ